jgi:hypothetical protein
MRKRRLKILTASVLLASFAALAGARAVRSLGSVSLNLGSDLVIPHTAITRYVMLEVPCDVVDLQVAQDPGITLTESDFDRAPPTPAPEYVVLAPGLFWTGRILRRIVSAEPDGH